MPASFIAIAVMVGLAGILVVLLGLLPSQEDQSAKMPSSLQRRLSNYRSQFSRRRQFLAVIGVAVGFIFFLVSGWVITLIAVPIAFIGIPLLLGRGSEGANIERLEAIENWTRSLSGLIVAGAGLEAAITNSLASAPAPIREPVSRLVARIGARWATGDALQAFADDLADPTGDLVVAHLQLAAQERGAGLGPALDDLAQDVFDEVKARRQIEADRAKPRSNIRLITYITVGVLAVLPFGGQFFAPYRSPIGQVLLAIWLVIYAGVLIWLKQLSAGRPTPRILTNPNETRS